MSFWNTIKIIAIVLVVMVTLAGWVGVAGPILGLVIGSVALVVAWWVWREYQVGGAFLLIALLSAGVPGALSAYLEVTDPSHDRVRLISIKAYEFGSRSSDTRMMSVMTNCHIAGNKGLAAASLHAFFKAYVMNPIAAFYPTSTLPSASIGEQLCLDELNRLRETEPDLFREFQEFWPELPQLLGRQA